MSEESAHAKASPPPTRSHVRSQPGRRRLPGEVGLLAVLGQVAVVVLSTAAFWIRGVAFGVFAASALLGLIVVTRLAWRERVLAAVIPVLFAATFVVLVLTITSAECSEAERAVAAELEPPPGFDIALTGSLEGGCSFERPYNLPAAEVLAHFQAQFEAHGFTPVRGESGQPGPPWQVAAAKDGYVVEVSTPGVRDLVIVSVYPLPTWYEPQACTERGVSAASALAAPPGVGSMRPWGVAGQGCVATAQHVALAWPGATVGRVIEHYRDELRANGWEITVDNETALTAQQDGLTLEVHVAELAGSDDFDLILAVSDEGR